MLLTLPFMLQKQQFPIVRNLFYENSLLILCQIHIWSVWLCIDVIEIESEMYGTALQELHNGMVQWEARVPSVPNSYHPFDFDLYIPRRFLASWRTEFCFPQLQLGSWNMLMPTQFQRKVYNIVENYQPSAYTIQKANVTGQIFFNPFRDSFEWYCSCCCKSPKYQLHVNLVVDWLGEMNDYNVFGTPDV